MNRRFEMAGGARWLPLVLHVVPSAIIGFVIVIPGSCIGGFNEHSVGFALTLAGFVPAYAAGLKLARRSGGNS